MSRKPVALSREQWDAIQHILADCAEQERFGSVPTDESVAVADLRDEIQDQLDSPHAEATADAGLSQSMAHPQLQELQMEDTARAVDRLDTVFDELLYDATAVDAARTALEQGDLSPKQALAALLFECLILERAEWECHHPPEKVSDDTCAKCDDRIPRIPGFDGGRRDTTHRASSETEPVLGGDGGA